uniref:Uncharacterized protein n=1 Tax=Vitis vinifera TaxID=29760 RepID=A5BQ45_VITVI|nr:hypothetical protein VITISV_036021 [Vitis vinifera]
MALAADPQKSCVVGVGECLGNENYCVTRNLANPYTILKEKRAPRRAILIITEALTPTNSAIFLVHPRPMPSYQLQDNNREAMEAMKPLFKSLASPGSLRHWGPRSSQMDTLFQLKMIPASINLQKTSRQVVAEPSSFCRRLSEIVGDDLSSFLSFYSAGGRMRVVTSCLK